MKWFIIRRWLAEWLYGLSLRVIELADKIREGDKEDEDGN